MGEDFTGYWLDRRTGKKIFVRDAIQDGDELVILTSEGQVPTEIFQQFYIKMSDEEFSSTGVTQEITDKNQMLSLINNGLESTDKIVSDNKHNQNNFSLDTVIGEIPQQTQPSLAQNTQSTVSDNNEPKFTLSDVNKKLIQKVLEKNPIDNLIVFNCEIEKLPVKEFELLIETFDISIDDICKYIINEYFNKDKLLEPFKEYFKTALYK